MKKAFIFISALVVVCITATLNLAGIAHAAPCSDRPIEVTQSDGSTITVHMRGDEFQSWVETEDGYTVIQNDNNGDWEYAEEEEPGKLKSTGVKARRGEAPPSHVKPHLKPPRNVEAEKDFVKMLHKVKAEQKEKDKKDNDGK